MARKCLGNETGLHAYANTALLFRRCEEMKMRNGQFFEHRVHEREKRRRILYLG